MYFGNETEYPPIKKSYMESERYVQKLSRDFNQDPCRVKQTRTERTLKLRLSSEKEKKKGIYINSLFVY